ncbi:hypothetical protein [Actinomadura madurae]|uniref:hypothetical protein n=1 Tax=Actinomadura madurae TaxID=1993 RepID=UPI0020D24948|nr:hypothetical protein [Actinomadura madurae]MCQ0008654.1 hypothetical protein [Actinomadura madurae]
MTDAARDAKAYQQVAKLKATLREREARLGEMEKRLAALETSTAVQFGRLVAGAARNPKRGKRLPKDLYRLWRKRNAPVPASGSAGGGRRPARPRRPPGEPPARRGGAGRPDHRGRAEPGHGVRARRARHGRPAVPARRRDRPRLRRRGHGRGGRGGR